MNEPLKSDPFGSFLQKPKASVVPLVRFKENKPVQFASGVLVKTEQAHFILTNAHVLDDVEGDDLLIPGKNAFFSPLGIYSKGPLPKSGKRCDDNIDVGFIRLDESEIPKLSSNLTFLTADDGDCFDVSEKGDAYSVIGYPATRTNIHNHKIDTKIIVMTGDGQDDEIYPSLGLNPKINLLVRYRRKKGFNPAKGQRVLMPKPAGMSGGGVFAWSKSLPNPESVGTPKLVGIVNEYRKDRGFFLATRIGFYIRCIGNL